MSSGELNRVELMGRVGSGELKLRDAAVILELSYRQTKRLWRRYRQVGSKGLKHGNAGRASNRSKPQKLRRRVLNLIREKYSGSKEERFGPTLAAEHLAEEDGIVLDHETLRLWMLAERLWSRQRKRKKHCQRRERKSHFGELVQLDGSFQFLEKEYLPQHNRRFARVPAKPEDYHGRKPTARELRQIFRVETERRISNDWVLRHEGHYLQLQPAGQRRYGPTQSKALVCEWEDGAMEVYYRGQRLAYRELAEPLPRKCEVDDRTKHSVAVPLFAKPRKPSQDHPWRRDYRGMKPSWSKKVEMPPLRMVARMKASL